MLKEVEVAQPLDLCVVNRVLAGRFGMSKSRARHEIDLNREPALSRIEIDRLHEPWSLDAKRSLEQWVGHERRCLPPPAGRSAALVGAKPTLAGRAVNPHLPPPCGFVDGAKRRRPQPHRVNNRNKEPTSPLVQPTQKSKEAF
jgi:hypothetical protein